MVGVRGWAGVGRVEAGCWMLEGGPGVTSGRSTPAFTNTLRQSLTQERTESALDISVITPTIHPDLEEYISVA